MYSDAVYTPYNQKNVCQFVENVGEKTLMVMLLECRNLMDSCEKIAINTHHMRELPSVGSGNSSAI